MRRGAEVGAEAGAEASAEAGAEASLVVLGGANPGELVVCDVCRLPFAVAATCPVVCAGVLNPVLKAVSPN